MFRSQLGFGVEFQEQNIEDECYKWQESHEGKESEKHAILKTGEGRGDVYLKNTLRIKTVFVFKFFCTMVMWKVIKQNKIKQNK